MIDLHKNEVLQEILDQINEYFEINDELDDAERYMAAEELLQEILDRISPIVEREA